MLLGSDTPCGNLNSTETSCKSDSVAKSCNLKITQWSSTRSMIFSTGPIIQEAFLKEGALGIPTLKVHLKEQLLDYRPVTSENSPYN